jgi:hypothetical protein
MNQKKDKLVRVLRRQLDLSASPQLPEASRERILGELLRRGPSGEMPNALPHSSTSPHGNQGRWWQLLWRGSIRVPVPLAIAILTLLGLLTGVVLRGGAGEMQTRSQDSSHEFNMADFQPVTDANVRILGGSDAR